MTPAQRAQLQALDAAETAGRRAEFLAKMGPPPPVKGKAAKAKAAKAKAAKAKAAKADAAKAVGKAVPAKGA